ncbi:DoxX family protein [Promicromonospora vindobonensis]|uniref:DoxX family protein n=1 Tax=Promicromonospora vindobonensis TaxID=195748 RepID=A0ABW5VQI1_9MICO
MDIGLLLLRLVIAAILFAHATQKLFGWFGGNGLRKQAGVFESLGLRPGRVMVGMAGTCELAAAALLGLGFLTPLGALVAFGTMATAGLTMRHASGAFWNVAGGGEYPFVLAAVAGVLAFAGPGRYAVDAALASAAEVFARSAAPGPVVGLVVVLVGVLATLPFVAMLRRASPAGA